MIIQLRIRETNVTDLRDAEVEAFTKIEPLMEQIEQILNDAGYRPFGRLDVVLPGNTDRLTISWRRER